MDTSVGSNWAPHYADIYMTKFEKEALLKAPLIPDYSYQSNVFIVRPHGENAFISFLIIKGLL